MNDTFDDGFGPDDFSHEEELFRQAFARHADDLADEPVAYEGARSGRERRSGTMPLAARWLAAAAAVAVVSGGGYAWLNRTQEGVPGPAASSAVPVSQIPIPSRSATPTPVPSPTPSPTVAASSASATPSGLLTSSPEPTPDPEPTTRPSSTPSASSTPVAVPTATRVASTRPAATASGAPTTHTTPLDDNELGDYNPDDPVPAPQDRLTLQTPITFNGWGAYQLGTTGKELVKRNLVVPVDYLCEGSMGAITTHRTLGLQDTSFINIDGALDTMRIDNPMVRTDRGAGTGMTLAQVEKLYGDQFAYEPKVNDYGPPIVMGRARQGDKEIIFVVETPQGEYAKATPTSTVKFLVVRQYSQAAPYMDAC